MTDMLLPYLKIFYQTYQHLMFDKNEFRKYAVQHLGMNSMHLDRYAQSVSAAAPNIKGFTPAVIEERQLNAVQMDVFSRLMMDRIIFMGVPVNEYVANVIQAQLLFLESIDPKRDVQMFINSPGGSVIDGLGIYDTMQYITPDVATICTGLSASMGAVLLCAGAKGKRSCLQHSHIMIHQPLGGAQGQMSDIEITYNLMKKMQKSLYDILSHHTGQPYEKIMEDCDRDNWMSGEEAKAYGLIDEVLSRSNPRKLN
jgi:ATP-dependent Clp protease, protease subunit